MKRCRPNWFASPLGAARRTKSLEIANGGLRNGKPDLDSVRKHWFLPEFSSSTCIRAGLDTQLLIGNQLARPQFLAISAEALWHAWRTREALESVEEGLAVSQRNGERYYDPQLWRLKGELLKMQGKATEAEDCFQKAIEIARQQAAKSFELRASTSLARLWQKNGKRKEAQHLLGDIYPWFTEGFDTADLQQAASLLKELS